MYIYLYISEIAHMPFPCCPSLQWDVLKIDDEWLSNIIILKVAISFNLFTNLSFHWYILLFIMYKVENFSGPHFMPSWCFKAIIFAIVHVNG